MAFNPEKFRDRMAESQRRIDIALDGWRPAPLSRRISRRPAWPPSMLLVAGLGYLAVGAMGYAPLPRLAHQRRVSTPWRAG